MGDTVDLRGWYRQLTTPILDGNNPDSARPISTDYPPAYTPSVDSRIMYVDATLGNDGTGAFTDVATQPTPFEPDGNELPYATVAAAMANVRSGYPDWVLLKRGETWTGTSDISIVSGRSPSEPYLVGCYGSAGARPILETGANRAINRVDNTDNYVVLFGLDFYAHTRDPNNPSFNPTLTDNIGLRWLGGGDTITIDDCVMRYYRQNITIEPYNGKSFSNFLLKNNIIMWAYGTGALGYGVGAFVSGTSGGFKAKSNVFYHNGWNDLITGATKSQYQHNIYIQTNNDPTGIEFSDNVSLDASAYGVHFRAGGQCYNNLISGCAIGLGVAFLGTPLGSGVTADIANNVVLQGTNMDPLNVNTATSQAVWGINVAPDAQDSGGTVLVTDNIVANRFDTGSISSINDSVNGTFTGNTIYEWEAAKDMTDVSWPHPEALIADYMGSIGETATHQAYVDAVTSRGVGVPHGVYSSTAVNNYLRGGFNL